MPTVLVFTTITLVITFVHLDKFHTRALSGIAWIAVYVAFPPAMAWVLWRQVRASAEDPPRACCLPAWVAHGARPPSWRPRPARNRPTGRTRACGSDLALATDPADGPRHRGMGVRHRDPRPAHDPRERDRAPDRPHDQLHRLRRPRVARAGPLRGHTRPQPLRGDTRAVFLAAMLTIGAYGVVAARRSTGAASRG
jgi:hypothetical protein